MKCKARKIIFSTFIFILSVFYFEPVLAGRWGVGNLDNDDSMDFLLEIVPDGEVGLLTRAFHVVLAAKPYPDDIQASRALAAAELIAASVGRPSANLPADCLEWATLHSPEVNKTLVRLALEAVDRITFESETLILMQEGEARELATWKENIESVKKRIRGE